jgi:hypothetical protein
MPSAPRILFCNCTYAQIIPTEVKQAVLKSLCDSEAAFDAVGDLCEMSARRDPALRRLAESGPVRIAACYPRAVKWLFAAAGAPLESESTEVLNMRVMKAEEVTAALNEPKLKPNLVQESEEPASDPPPPAVATNGSS